MFRRKRATQENSKPLTRMEVIYKLTRGKPISNSNGIRVPYLTCADLSGCDLAGVNFAEACLMSNNMSGANLRDADLSGTDLQYVNLRGADLTGANLRDANVDMLQLGQAQSLEGAILPDGRICGKPLTREDFIRLLKEEPFHPRRWGLVYYLIRLDLTDARLPGTDLHGLNLRQHSLARADLSGANLAGVDLFDANLVGASLRNANLCGALLGKTRLGIHTDFSGAILCGANFAEAVITDAPARAGLVPVTMRDLRSARSTDGVFLHSRREVDRYASPVDPDLSVLREEIERHLGSATLDLSCRNLAGGNFGFLNLESANLSCSNLARAKLVQAELRYADLSGANLYYADLTGADLRHANLSGANLNAATLTGADLRETKVTQEQLEASGK